MTKKYIYLTCLFLFSFVSFAQKVTLTPTTVNGSSYGSGAINLRGVPYSTVGLSVKVDMPSVQDNSGTVTIYVVSGLNPTVAIGGGALPVFFGGGKTATQSFTININWSSISTLGGQVYAEYKTSGGIQHKSNYIAVVKDATQGGGIPQTPADAPDPSKIVNTLCCNQTIRLGEKPAPIKGSQYLNPYKYEPYGINASWIGEGNRSVNISLDGDNGILNIDYITEPGNFSMTRSIGYNKDKTKSNKSNTVTITVVPSPILENEIRINSSKNTDGSFELSSSNPKDIIGDKSSINLNVLQNPSYIPKRYDPTTPIEKYEWEYSITNGTTEERLWNKIPNQSSSLLNSLYLPRTSSSKDYFYKIRRIAIYQNLRISSNILGITLRALRDNNTICCDQTLQISSTNIVDSPSTITGTNSISNIGTNLFYQWQRQTVTNDGEIISNWTDIPKASSQNYTPPAPEFTPGSGNNQPTVPTYNYRRIATDTFYNGETYYSNEISITPYINVSRFKLPVLIYPNPTSSILNIEDTRTLLPLGDIKLADLSINIANIMGVTVNSNNFLLVNPKLITIDVSNLTSGTYIMNISGMRNRRSSSQQFTFIKK